MSFRENLTRIEASAFETGALLVHCELLRAVGGCTWVISRQAFNSVLFICHLVKN